MKFERLGNICTVRNGYAFKSANFSNSGVPIIRISDINDNSVSLENAVKTKYESVFDNYKIEKGDILIAMSGATTGKYGQYNSDEISYQNQRVGCFKILDNKILNQDYLFQAIKLLKPVIEKKAYGGGQPNISAKAIEDLIFPLPPIETQLHIANILTKAESLIAQRKESIRQLDEYLKSVFLEMFGDPATNSKNWDKTTLKEVCIKIQDGTHFSPPITPEGIPYITAKHVRENKVDFWANPWFISEESHKEIYRRCNPKKGDVLYIKDGATTGYAAINPYDFEFSMLSSLALLKPKTHIANSQYICSWLNNPNAKASILTNMAGGAIKRLTLTKINALPILLPPLELQAKFAQMVEKTETIKAQYQISLQELENLYGSLSQKAFKGELNLKYEGLLMAAEPETKYGE